MAGLSSRTLAQIAAVGSALLILGALVFEYLGYAPCKMCYWQRWPHYAAALSGALFMLVPLAAFLWLGAASAATTAALGLYHSGVEQKWWPGPSSCSGGGPGLSGLSGDDLLSTEITARVVMCDEISWQFLALSMPTWNAILSCALVAVWVAAWLKAKQAL
ncbi:MAG: disulfide bond formation protein B [Pseudomonadota bacterium]